MNIVCHDWRDRPAAEIVPLLEAEQRRWRTDLDWDVTRSWLVIEPARASGALPGLIARDAFGAIRGWTCFLVHDGALQVAAFVSDTAAVTEALVDAILASVPAREATSCLLFTPDRSPGLRAVLAARAFRLESYRYLAADVPVAGKGREFFRPWRDGDAGPVARVFERAYAGSTVIRPFALAGQPSEWREYVDQLIARPDCGDFVPGASVVATEDGDVVGAAMVSQLTARTAHLMQVAVDPAVRGRGLGRALLVAASAAAARAGARRMTLLVAASNAPAVTLYESLGWRDVAMFIAARR